MYAPGIFASEEELTALCKVVGEYGGIYTSHVRDQGNHVEQCVAETINVAKNAGVRANISHHKASGKDNWGKVKNTIKMIHDAVVTEKSEADATVMHDVYPYAAASTTLMATLPPNVQKLGGPEIIAYLSDTNNHEELKNAIFNPVPGFESPLNDCGYDGLMIFHAAKTSDAIGKSVALYADELKIEPFDAYIKLLIDNELTAGFIGFSMSEADVEMLLADPLCMFGTDALYVEGMPMTHPRAIGTFPRILGHYVRQMGLLTLEEAIRKMTSLPASFYGLQGKGQIKEGMDADIVIFDPNTIKDNADYKQPLLPNEGINRVIVGGKIAITENERSGVLNGKVVKMSR
jgi:N-acyl-D-amino-acid deacylase